MGPEKVLLIIGLLCMLKRCDSLECKNGTKKEKGQCVDVNECEEDPETPDICVKDALCFNTIGSYYCQCKDGFSNVRGQVNFTAVTGQCLDINECTEDKDICGAHASCTNMIGSYNCTCLSGYSNTSDGCKDVDECINEEICKLHAYCTNLMGSYNCTCLSGYYNTDDGCMDTDECKEDKDICGVNGTCQNLVGSYKCNCSVGYSNYGNEKTPCSELQCDQFNATAGAQSSPGLSNILSLMRKSCNALSNGTPSPGDTLLEMFTAVEGVLVSPDHLDSSDEVTGLLDVVENAMRLIGPQLKDNQTHTLDTNQTEAKLAVRKGKTPPTGSIHLSNENATLDTDWQTASGTGTYPGFALAALVSYKNLEKSVNHSFEHLGQQQKDGVDPDYQIYSKVVSAVVSNPSTKHLDKNVSLTLRHLQERKDLQGGQNPRPTHKASFICAYWKAENGSDGAWATDGCTQQSTNATHTVCHCDHLSSFAVLMALYPLEYSFELELLTTLGLVLSLLCLAACILTFGLCRSIQGTRTTIHLHLCISLFIADLIFLAGISKTKPEGGCRLVAALLHYFFLGSFSWMLLEGVQLYRMVVLVFNATIRPLYLYAVGYGTPLAIVVISAISRNTGHGTERHCWLSLKHGFIWSFFGPVCVIIILNVIVFIITVWKLAQKFTSINPDLSKLRKIKAFTVTAVAQLCVLGSMWVFGAFLFTEGKPVRAVEYIFVILNSLQGVLIFVLHCLLSKQVREEYSTFLSCIQQKTKYSDFSSTNPSSSQSQGNRSARHTGESKI